MILTDHGARDGSRLKVGGTALAVSLNAGTSLMLIPTPPRGGSAVARKDIGSRSGPGYAEVLVPVDFGPRSDWALGLAAAIARDSGGRIRLAHVLTTPELLGRFATGPRSHPLAAEVRAVNRREATVFMEALRRRLESPDLHVETDVLESDGCPARAIQHVAQQREVDLVVLSAHGHGDAREWPFGGETGKLLLSATIPTLVLQDPRPMTKSDAEAAALEVDPAVS